MFKSKYFLYILIFIFFDLFSKHLALNYLNHSTSVEFIPFIDFYLTFNSGIAFGFTASYFFGRMRFGPDVWETPNLAMLQMISAVFSLSSIMILGSIGSKITLGESTLDFLPFWPEFASSIVINQWLSLLLLIVGIISLVISLRTTSVKNLL